MPSPLPSIFFFFNFQISSFWNVLITSDVIRKLMSRITKLDMTVKNEDEQGNVKAESCICSSNHSTVEFRIWQKCNKAKIRNPTLSFKRAEFSQVRDLLRTISQDTATVRRGVQDNWFVFHYYLSSKLKDSHLDKHKNKQKFWASYADEKGNPGKSTGKKTWATAL